ncbi:MAG: FHA domain-containing protein [Myxococcales bacterium]
MAVKLVVRHPGSSGERGEVSFEFEQVRVAIGRSAGADVRLPGLTVSELHATLELQGGQARLRDEGSTNGTRVNGVALVPTRPRSLITGDVIEIGDFSIAFSSGPLLGVATSPERTASLARRLLQELADPSSEARAAHFLRIAQGPDQGTLINLAEAPSRLVIGRGEEAGLVLRDPDVSREHLEICCDLDGAVARDLASKNGLEVNGKRLRERRLRHGDTLRLGATAIVYEDPAEQALRGLEGQPDQLITRTRESAPAATAESAPSAASESASPSGLPAASAPARTQVPKTASTDLLIYGLAALILVASLAGLVWLFR